MLQSLKPREMLDRICGDVDDAEVGVAVEAGYLRDGVVGDV